jgi:hypothetical protein
MPQSPPAGPGQRPLQPVAQAHPNGQPAGVPVGAGLRQQPRQPRPVVFDDDGTGLDVPEFMRADSVRPEPVRPESMR